MTETNLWTRIIEEDPEHSARYIQRFKDMEAEGRDLHGEARFIDAMVERHSRILDAGCGPGRVGGRLAELGHEVVGVDLDPVLIEEAASQHPASRWIVGDLAELDLTAHGIGPGFDVIVVAGNVMTFLAPSTRRNCLRNLRQQLRADGRIVTGFGADRGYPFDEFLVDVEGSGLGVDLTMSTWDLRPFDDESDFLVAVLSA